MSNMIENIEFFINQSKSNFEAARETMTKVIDNGWTFNYMHIGSLMETQARYEMALRLERILVAAKDRGDSDEKLSAEAKSVFGKQIMDLSLTSRSTSPISNIFEDYQREALMKAYRLFDGQTW